MYDATGKLIVMGVVIWWS